MKKNHHHTPYIIIVGVVIIVAIFVFLNNINISSPTLEDENMEMEIVDGNGNLVGHAIQLKRMPPIKMHKLKYQPQLLRLRLIELNCEDGIDNDNNGLTDCEEKRCINTTYCINEESGMGDLFCPITHEPDYFKADQINVYSISEQSWKTVEEKCIKANTVLEFFCNVNETIQQTEFKCPSACYNGACAQI